MQDTVLQEIIKSGKAMRLWVMKWRNILNNLLYALHDSNLLEKCTFNIKMIRKVIYFASLFSWNQSIDYQVIELLKYSLSYPVRSRIDVLLQLFLLPKLDHGTPVWLWFHSRPQLRRWTLTQEKWQLTSRTQV